MKSDCPLIASVLFLASGLGLIFGFCHGTAGLSAAFPVAASQLQLAITTTGPAALGGIALTSIGLLLMVWAVLAAIVSQVTLLGDRPEPHDRIAPPDRVLE
jgi:hypothetical protein